MKGSRILRACLILALLLSAAPPVLGLAPSEGPASPSAPAERPGPYRDQSQKPVQIPSPADLKLLETTSYPLAFEASIPRLSVISASLEPHPDVVEGGTEVPTIPIPDRREVAAVIKEFNSIGRRALQIGLDRAGRYMDLVRTELGRLDLPQELAALPLIESHYSVAALSSAGAAGLWQFIPTTARNYKLRVDWWVDERLDPLASTRAAANHLRDLYAKFGDWDLVLAAYNSGAGRIGRATATKDGTCPDFWEICDADKIAAQTKRYVPKFYAALAIMTSPVDFGFKSLETSDPLEFDLVTVDSPLALTKLAARTGIDEGELFALNPALKRGVTPPGDTFDIKVPKGFGEIAALAIKKMTDEERLDFKRHKIVSGDTISRISKKYSTPAEAILSLNRITDPRRLRTGTELVIPVTTMRGPAPKASATAIAKAGSTAAKKEPARAKSAYHTVAAGETLYAIARRYGIGLKDAMTWNGLNEKSVIKPGMRLNIGGPN